MSWITQRDREAKRISWAEETHEWSKNITEIQQKNVAITETKQEQKLRKPQNQCERKTKTPKQMEDRNAANSVRHATGSPKSRFLAT